MNLYQQLLWQVQCCNLQLAIARCPCTFVSTDWDWEGTQTSNATSLKRTAPINGSTKENAAKKTTSSNSTFNKSQQGWFHGEPVPTKIRAAGYYLLAFLPTVVSTRLIRWIGKALHTVQSLFPWFRLHSQLWQLSRGCVLCQNFLLKVIGVSSRQIQWNSGLPYPFSPLMPGKVNSLRYNDSI